MWKFDRLWGFGYNGGDDFLTGRGNMLTYFKDEARDKIEKMKRRSQ